jgi:hypothetical protein
MSVSRRTDYTESVVFHRHAHKERTPPGAGRAGAAAARRGNIVAVVRDWFAAHRRRIGAALLAVGGSGLLVHGFRNVPHDAVVAVKVADPASVREVRLGWSREGDEVGYTQLGYVSGAPRRIEQRMSLVPGTYELRVDVRRADGRRESMVRRLEVPTEGETLIDATREGA